jgi:Ca2+-binding EF-hand superfamily protein
MPETRDRDELKQAAFDFFKGDDEILSEVELARLLDAADYAVDGGYIQQVLQIFGKFDDDGSSGIDSAEFGQLWDYLDLDEKMKLSGMEDMILGQRSAPQTAAALFNKYDTNRDGLLDMDEVRALMDDVGYDVDEDYLEGVHKVFGRFDTDQGGTIGLSEFPALWKHLAPDRPLRDHTMDTTGMDVDQMFLCLQKFYRKFDPLRSKERLWETVNLYNTPAKFQHLCNQLFGKYGEHPVTIWKGPEVMRPRDQICAKHLRAFESHVQHGQSALREAENLLRTVTVNEHTIQVKARNGTQYIGAGLNSVHRSQHRITVKFEDKDQQVGLQLVSQWIDGVRIICVQAIRPRSMAARVRELGEGLTVELIDGTKVAGIKMFLIEKMLLRRPVTVVFGAGGSGEESAVRANATSALIRDFHPTMYDSDDETPVAREDKLVRTRNRLRHARDLGAVSLQQYDLVRADEHFLSEMDEALKQPTVEVTFDREGNLGIIFTAKDANSAPIIASIERNSLAADKPQLQVGLELTAMQGQPIAGKTFRHVIGELQSAECPLTLQFKHTVSIHKPQERRMLTHRPYREAESWAVKPTVGAAGLVVRSLPSQVASELGRVAANSTVRVVGKEGDWVQIEWSAARTGRHKWEKRASAEGDEAVGWLQIEDRGTGKIFLEKTTGASYFNLGQSLAGVGAQPSLSARELESVLDEMREAAQQDDDDAMTIVLQKYAEATTTDQRLNHAWQELRAVRSAKRAEVAQQQQVEALRHHQMQLRQSGRRAQQSWREQSWAEKERAVASSLLN